MSTKKANPTEYVMDDGAPPAPDNQIRPPQMNRVPREFTPEIAAELKQALEISGLPFKLYKITFDTETYIVRPLMLRDWLEVQKFIQSNSALRQDQVDRKVVELGLVWPQEILHPLRYEIQRAGLQKSLADNIMARSGFIVADVDQSEFLKVEPLFTVESGPRPTPEIVEHLKTQTDWPLKLVFLDDEFFVIRPLSRAEWTILTKMGEGADVDVATCEKACIWTKEFPAPATFEDRMGGTASTLSALTMQFSGFTSRPQIEEL